MTLLKKFIKNANCCLNNLSFQKKLIMLYSTMMILFLFAVGYSIYYYTAFTIKSEVVNFAEISARQISKSVDGYVDEMSRLSSMTLTDGKLMKIMKNAEKKKSSVEEMDNYEYILGFLFNIYTFSSDLYSVNLITNNGKVYSEFISDNNSSYDIKKEDWYAQFAKNPAKPLFIGPRLTTMLTGPGNGKQVISVVRRILTPDGIVVGTIMIDKKYESFRDIFSEIENERKAQVLVLDDKRVLYNSAGSSEKYLGWIDSIKINTSSSAQYQRVNVDGEMNLVVVAKSSYTGWNTIMAVPEKQLLSNINRIKFFVIILVFISTIISVLIYFVISSEVTKPVKKLTALMKRVEEGDFTVSADVQSNDEIGKLGRGFNHMISKINLLLKKMVDLEVRKKESEYKALQSQINPHFLYNTLESIRMKCIVKGEREIAEVINTLGILFRLSIDREDNFATVKDELEHVRHYMTIQNFRYDNKFKLIINVDKELMHYRIFKLMLQPLVENSILHGLEMKPDDGYIKIDMSMNEGVLHIDISDNGLGMNNEEYDNLMKILQDIQEGDVRRSVGMRNVNERIKIFFGDEYGLSVMSRVNEGTTINIRMPAFIDETEVKLFV